MTTKKEKMMTKKFSRDDGIRSISKRLSMGEQPFYHSQANRDLLNETVNGGKPKYTAVDLAVREIVTKNRPLRQTAYRYYSGDKDIRTGEVLSPNCFARFENAIRSRLNEINHDYDP